MTCNSFENSVSTLAPPFSTRTVSSIRTPPKPGQIDPGLDGDHHPLLKDGIGQGREPGGFVDVESHTVPRPMGKERTVTGLLDDASCRGIHVAAGNTGPHRLQCPVVGFLDNGIDFLVPLSRPADGKGAGLVRVVPAPDGPVIDDHEVPRPDLPASRPGMGKGAVGT